MTGPICYFGAREGGRVDTGNLIDAGLSFLLGYLGTVTSKEYNAAKYAEMEVRSLTGAGAHREALDH